MSIDLARYYANVGSETSFHGESVLSADVVVKATPEGGTPREVWRFLGTGDAKVGPTTGYRINLGFPTLAGNIDLEWPSLGGTIARLEDITGGVTDHGALTGLSDDDHTHYHNDARADTWLATKTTTNLTEGINLYYTTARANTAIDARVTQAFVNALNVNAATVTVADAASDTTTFLGLWGAATGSLPALTDSGLAYNASTNTLTLTGSGTGLAVLGPWASNNAWYAMGLAGSVAAGDYNFRSGPADTYLYINAPLSREIRFRINDVTQAVIEGGGLVPASAGSTTLGRASLGWNGLYLDSSSSSNTIAIVGGAVSPSNITLTTPTSTGTLALTSDIHAAVTLSGTPDYITLSGQDIVRGLIDLTTDVTGALPAGNGGTGIAALGTGVATALGVNVGTAGAFVVNGGALGTPSSGVATNLTGTAAGLTAGNVTTNANLTGPITSVGNATSVASQTGTGSTFVMSAAPTLTGNAVAATLAVDALNLSSGDKIRFDDGSGNEYSIFRNASNDIELRRNIGGAAQQGFLFSSGYLGLSQTVRTDIGQSTSGFSSVYFREDGVAAGVGTDTLRLVAPAITGAQTVTLPAATGTLATLAGSEALSNKTYAGSTATLTGLAKASSLNLTLGGTELALATDEVAMFTRRSALSDNARIGINSGTNGYGILQFYAGGTAIGGVVAHDTGFSNTAILTGSITGLLSTGAASVTVRGAADVVDVYDNAGNTQFTVRGSGASNPSTIEAFGKFRTYNNIATVSNGVPSIYAEINATAQAAAIAGAALYTPPAAGMYRVQFAITQTQAATVSSILGGANGVRLLYTSGDGATAKTQVVPMLAVGSVGSAQTFVANTNANTVGTTLIGEVTIYSGAAAMTYSVDYTSVGATAMQYAARVRVERL